MKNRIERLTESFEWAEKRQLFADRRLATGAKRVRSLSVSEAFVLDMFTVRMYRIVKQELFERTHTYK